MRLKYEDLRYYYADELDYLLDTISTLLSLDYSIIDSMDTILNRSSH